MPALLTGVREEMPKVAALLKASFGCFHTNIKPWKKCMRCEDFDFC